MIPAGNPLEGVRILVYDSDDEYGVGSSSSDAEGYYTVKCLPTGDYYVRTRNYECYHEDWYNDAKTEGEDLPRFTSMLPYETQDIDFTLEPGGTISGRVLDVKREPIRAGAGRSCILNSDWVNDGKTDANGYYAVCGLHTGGYFVQTYYCDEHWYQGAIPWGNYPAPVYVVVPDETQNVDFVFEGWGSISGQILGPTGSRVRKCRSSCL